MDVGGLGRGHDLGHEILPRLAKLRAAVVHRVQNVLQDRPLSEPKEGRHTTPRRKASHEASHKASQKEHEKKKS